MASPAELNFRKPPFSPLTSAVFSSIAQRADNLNSQEPLVESNLNTPEAIFELKNDISTSCQSLEDDQVLPVLYRDSRNHLIFVKDNVKGYIFDQLDVSRLNHVDEYLWLAGRPMSARALHRQKMIGREIILTEQADLHLTWIGSRFYVKPLPMFLLNFNFWTQSICPDQELYRLACGFLVSYVWLICQASDLKIAIDSGLLPSTITWSNWVTLVTDLTLAQNIDIHALDTVNRRYLYGELRLSRLSKIYRFSPKFGLKYLFRGYQSNDTGYRTFFDRHFAWILVLFVYISIVLASAQLGLATEKLQQSLAFQRISLGLTMSCIMLPAAFLCLIIVWFVALFTYNLVVTLIFHKGVTREREEAMTRKWNASV